MSVYAWMDEIISSGVLDDTDVRTAPAIIKPSAAQRAARLARPWETPNSSRTATKDCRSAIKDSGDMTWAEARWAKKWIY